ncbi:glutamate ABC transporter substrate-binding protein [Streptomyces sp. NBC_01190]|uniref:glutamate ABC transporter substrate-binding protein n=1 Tax=Streptomyces sp. NBC_01190 TaxID=2903767 RepID=UPI003863995D|nr:glutamate ABC transporter substrate-binding protein [Streptomyces sp. NBC_01190]
MRASWRGWGGVAAMAAACALALTSAVAPLHDSGFGGRLTSAARDTPVPARYASTHDAPKTCAHPEASLDPALGSTDGAAVRAIAKRGRLRVGVDQNSYLWGFLDPNTHQLAGFDIDIVKAIAKDILGPDAKVQYLTVPTDQRIYAIQHDQVDMVVRTMSVTCERLSQVAFSTAYFTAGQQLLVPEGSPVKGYDATLRNKTVCAARGSTGLAKLTDTGNGTRASDARRFGARVLIVDNQLDCLVRVQLGQADAVFTDNALAAGQAAQDPLMHLVGEPVTQEPYGVAMKLGAPDLVRRVNRILAGYESGGTGSAWQKSYTTWLAQDLPGITGPPAPVYRPEP